MTKAGAVVLLVVMATGLVLLACAAQGSAPATRGSIGPLDLWTAQQALNLRSPGLVQAFTFLTAFGYWGVVLLLAGSASAIMVICRRAAYLSGLWFGLMGNQISVYFLKTLFGRPRPPFAVYQENSAAFPSGHSAASVVIFGFLASVLIRERLLPRILVGVTGMVAVVMVGLSRLYLLEHYLSDVLSGYLVGAAWLVLAICLSGAGPAKGDLGDIRHLSLRRRFAVVAVVVITGTAMWVGVDAYTRGLLVTAPSLSARLG